MRTLRQKIKLAIILAAVFTATGLIAQSTGIMRTTTGVVYVRSWINAIIVNLATLTRDGIGTTSTSGFDLKNTTAAAAGAQQYSPRTCWEGQGWKTTATAASQSVVFCLETQPVQGTSAPSGNFILKASINGGAFVTVGTFTSDGALRLTGTSDPTNFGALFFGTDVQRYIRGNAGDFEWGPSFNVARFRGTGETTVEALAAANTNAFKFRRSNASTSGDNWTFQEASTVQVGIDHEGNLRTIASHRGGVVAFAALPASPVEGMLITVTDSSTATWGDTITGGGANRVLAYYNGTNWTVAGK